MIYFAIFDYVNRKKIVYTTFWYTIEAFLKTDTVVLFINVLLN